MATVSTVHVPQQQSVLQKLAMGAMMGTGVGLCIGFIGASVQILRAGPGPRGAMGTLAQFMGTSAATFGFFMSIGTVIRTEDHDPRWTALASQSGRYRLIQEELKRKSTISA
ncbi:hypothetical protein CBS101457_003253 [Exobasidium rhododendri]|nr:hypothetical protein CBS101457_003253 [Exobasidium rhododendri]